MSISRAYGCTAPAIAYIIKRSTSAEARGVAAGPGAGSDSVEPSRPGAQPAAACGLDHELRERINSDIAAFLVAFEAACDELTGNTCEKLLESTDRLVLAGARTRIALQGWAEGHSP